MILFGFTKVKSCVLPVVHCALEQIPPEISMATKSLRLAQTDDRADITMNIRSTRIINSNS